MVEVQKGCVNTAEVVSVLNNVSFCLYVLNLLSNFVTAWQIRAKQSQFMVILHACNELAVMASEQHTVLFAFTLLQLYTYHMYITIIYISYVTQKRICSLLSPLKVSYVVSEFFLATVACSLGI